MVGLGWICYFEHFMVAPNNLLPHMESSPSSCVVSRSAATGDLGNLLVTFITNRALGASLGRCEELPSKQHVSFSSSSVLRHRKHTQNDP